MQPQPPTTPPPRTPRKAKRKRSPAEDARETTARERRAGAARTALSPDGVRRLIDAIYRVLRSL